MWKTWSGRSVNPRLRRLRLLRLVLDTNIWISAFLTPGGLCEKLVRAHHRDDLKFLTSRAILKETEEVLIQKFKMPGAMVEERLKYVIRHAQLVEPTQKLAVLQTCEADNRILECAVAGRASHLVTGDKSHLLPLGQFEGIEIVTPRRMVDWLRL
jgi:putative PIN family toxin of toxin-antitoxin system